MPSDDILDLLGRYATGSLSAGEQKRLFDAALEDQDLFDQLAREQDLKKLLDEPGVRDRMILALQPPKRRWAWIFGVAATAAVSAALVVVLLRPTPKPPQIAMAQIAPPATLVQTESAPAPPKSEASSTPEAKATNAPVSKETPAGAPKAEAKKKDAAPVQAVSTSQTVEVTSAPAVQQASQAFTPAQQDAVGGPKQMAVQNRVARISNARAADSKTSAFSFHYSVEIPGHLSIIPAMDGYLYVKANDGTVLFGPKLSPAGIMVDLTLTDAVSSAVITFSENAAPVGTKPTLRTEPTGDVEGTAGLAIELKIRR